MDIKRNDATANRPEGDRIIDAHSVFMDIPVLLEQLKQENSWIKNDRNSITAFKSDRLTMVVTALKAGAEMTSQKATALYTVLVLQGEVVIRTNDLERDVTKGQAMAFHPDELQSIRAISESHLLLTSYCKTKTEE